jgi:hypothetical protein
MDRRTFVGLTVATATSSLLSLTAFAQTAPKAKSTRLLTSARLRRIYDGAGR